MKTTLPLLLVMSFLALVGGCTNEPPGGLTPALLNERISNDEAPLILDVRTEAEFVVSHIPGAVNIPHTSINQRLAELPKDKSAEIVVHCVSGVRAANAEETLTAAGYSNLTMLEGHFAEWSRLELPLAQGTTR
jgi:phage shock protein E